MVASTSREQGLWKIALLYLVGLGSFFFISYGFATWFTLQRDNVGSLVFAWEQFIPLWPWTIIPYWSIDFLYGLAILLALTRKELNTLALRLLTAQIICVSCFLLFPLHFSFNRPALDGFFGLLFDILMGFDKPYNQAPSLHITLLVILWCFYAKHIHGCWRYLLHVWFFLIGLSVLTTWQHHFFDVPTGALVGCLCIWLWPDNGSSLFTVKKYPKWWKWASIYAGGSLFFFCLALYLQGTWLWLCWISIALLLVALNYSVIGASGFQKQANGKFRLPVLLLYVPYLLIAWINSRLWTRHNNKADHIVDGVYLGRIPDQKTLKQFSLNTIVDCCAELPIACYQGNYYLIPLLDMTIPSLESIDQGVEVITQHYPQGNLLVCCALGYSRSAMMVIAWLVWSERVATIPQAIALVKQARSIVISTAQQQQLEQWVAQKNDRK